MDLPTTGHDPVLLSEVIDYLRPKAGDVVVDCTLGRGGHASKLANFLGDKGLLIGLDVDPRNLEFVKERLKDAICKVRLFHANFAELEDVLAEVGIAQVDAIMADLGISTNQLFE